MKQQLEIHYAIARHYYKKKEKKKRVDEFENICIGLEYSLF